MDPTRPLQQTATRPAKDNFTRRATALRRAEREQLRLDHEKEFSAGSAEVEINTPIGLLSI